MRASKVVRWAVAVVLGAVVAAGVAWIGVAGRTYGSDPQIEALLGDPDAALTFLYPDGVVEPGTSPVAIEYIRDRNWDNSGFDTLAQMLDEAATAHRDLNDPLSELSSLAATDTINLLGERGDHQIGDKAYDSLGHLIAIYITDVDTSAFLPDDDLPPPARFYSSAMMTVLQQVLTDEEALREIVNAAIQQNRYAIARSVRLDSDPREVDNLVRADIHQGTEFLALLGYAAGFTDATRPDPRTDAMLDELGNTANLLPRPGARFAEYVKGIDIVDHSHPLPRQNYVLDDSDDVRGDIASAVAMSHFYATGVQLGEAGGLSDGRDGQRYPWFVDGEFRAEVALAPEHLGAFFSSLRNDPFWGETFSEIRADLYNNDLGWRY